MKKDASILIVDDSDFDRSLLAKALARKSGFKLLEANSGKNCFETLENQKIDLVLLDVMMPDMDGNHILEKIREKSNAVELPIIMITGKSDATDVILSLQLGANDYITKPVSFDVAMTRISNQLMISSLSKEMIQLQEIAALHAVVATYNHEINNPLAIAVANLNLLHINPQNAEALTNAENALWRVADIVKQIKKVTEGSNITYVEPVAGKNLIKVK